MAIDFIRQPMHAIPNLTNPYVVAFDTIVKNGMAKVGAGEFAEITMPNSKYCIRTSGDDSFATSVYKKVEKEGRVEYQPVKATLENVHLFQKLIKRFFNNRFNLNAEETSPINVEELLASHAGSYERYEKNMYLPDAELEV